MRRHFAIDDVNDTFFGCEVYAVTTDVAGGADGRAQGVIRLRIGRQDDRRTVRKPRVLVTTAWVAVA